MLDARVAFLLCLALLLPVATSLPIACCAGTFDLHASVDDGSHCGSDGGGCCERSGEDASARRCCEGGARFDRAQTLGNHIALEPVEPLFGVSPRLVTSLVSFDSTPDPVPKAEPLYTLHASLLI